MPLIAAFTGVKSLCSWLTASAVPTTLLVNAAWTNPSAIANTTPSTMNTVTSVLALLDRTSHHDPKPVTAGGAPYPACCAYPGCCCPYPGVCVTHPCGSPYPGWAPYPGCCCSYPGCAPYPGWAP